MGLIVKTFGAIRWFALSWLIVLLTVSIMGYHLFHGRTLVNAEGKLDMKKGFPNQISYDGFYRSVIFTTLTTYD